MAYGQRLKLLIVTELHPIIYELAPSVAYAVHRRYKHWVEREDVTQECIAWGVTRNAYMKAYQQRKRDNMTYEEWRAFRDKNNAYHKKRYDNRTPEQIEKNRAYQRQKQKLVISLTLHRVH